MLFPLPLFPIDDFPVDPAANLRAALRREPPPVTGLFFQIKADPYQFEGFMQVAEVIH
jgi:hypothetical protein